MSLKAAFLDTAVKMYPQGLAEDPKQHRDVIRVYTMGWRDAVITAKDRGMVLDVASDCKRMADPNWWPDKSWRWW